MSSSRSDQRGFGLVEILLVLVVVAIAGALLYRYFGATARTVEKLQAQRPLATSKLAADPAPRALRPRRTLRDRRRLPRLAVVADRRFLAGWPARRRYPVPLRDRPDVPAGALRPRLRGVRRRLRPARDPLGLGRGPDRARPLGRPGRRALPGGRGRDHVLAAMNLAGATATDGNAFRIRRSLVTSQALRSSARATNSQSYAEHPERAAVWSTACETTLSSRH